MLVLQRMLNLWITDDDSVPVTYMRIYTGNSDCEATFGNWADHGMYESCFFHKIQFQPDVNSNYVPPPPPPPLEPWPLLAVPNVTRVFEVFPLGTLAEGIGFVEIDLSSQASELLLGLIEESGIPQAAEEEYGAFHTWASVLCTLWTMFALYWFFVPYIDKTRMCGRLLYPPRPAKKPEAAAAPPKQTNAATAAVASPASRSRKPSMFERARRSTMFQQVLDNTHRTSHHPLTD